MSHPTTWCPRCGPDVSASEWGRCRTCGEDATGYGAEQAHRYRRRAVEAEARCSELSLELGRLQARVEGLVHALGKCEPWRCRRVLARMEEAAHA